MPFSWVVKGALLTDAHSGSHVSDAKEDWWQKLLSIPALKHLLIQNPIKKT